MKKIVIIVTSVFFSVIIIGSVFAQQAVRQNTTGLEKAVNSMKQKIAGVDAKLDKILENQEKIFEEIKILKIRIRRS